MGNLKLLVVCVLALGLLWGYAGHAEAATTGKITGKVTDGQGNPLPGANVIVAGMRLGASADVEGRYLILAVSPGKHRLTASMVGYGSVSQTDVNVQVDYTMTVDFILQEETIQTGEIVVVAERPLVERDKTTSKYVVSSEEIEQLSIVREVDEFVSLQAGSVPDGSLQIRGSQADDATFYVDGVPIVTYDGQSRFNRFHGVNTSAVQELTVLTGGWEAEYGNAQGGIINIVTREGGLRYSGRFEYVFEPVGKKHWGKDVYEAPQFEGNLRWDDSDWVNETYADNDHPGPDFIFGTADDNDRIHTRTDYTGVTGHFFEGFFSGPLTRSATFFASSRTDRSANASPGAAKRIPANTQNTGKLSLDLTFNMKLNIGGFYHRTWGDSDGRVQITRRQSIGGSSAGISRGMQDAGRNLFLPSGSTVGKFTDTDNLLYAFATHTLSPRTFYEVRLSWSSASQDTSGLPAISENPIRDKQGFFNLPRKVRAFEVSRRHRVNFKADLSSQVTSGHLLKTGIDLTLFNSWGWGFVQENPSIRRISYYGDNSQIEEAISPIQLTFYAQDKMEFEGMVVNAGLRLDAFYPRFDRFTVPAFPSTPMYNSYTLLQKAPTTAMENHIAVSPRVGVSHPITASSIIRFFYGKFYRWPEFRTQFGRQFFANAPDQDLDNNGQIDEDERFNGLTETDLGTWFGHYGLPEQTSSFEVGMDWNAVSDYVLSMTAFYKSTDDQHSSRSGMNWNDPRTGSPNRTGVPVNRWWEDMRGLEFSLRKRVSPRFYFRAAYNVQWASAGQTSPKAYGWYPDSTWVAAGNYWYKYEVVNGEEVPVPLTEAEIRDIGHNAQERIRGFLEAEDERILIPVKDEPGFWGLYNPNGGSLSDETGPFFGSDIRAFGSLQAFYQTPSDWGPKVGRAGLLGNIQFNLIYHIRGGNPFVYSPPEGGSEIRHRPIRTWTDFNAQKTFRELGGRGLNLTLFVETFNIFGQKDRNAGNFDYVQYGLRKPRPNDPNYKLYGDPRDRSFWGRPRDVHLGLRVRF